MRDLLLVAGRSGTVLENALVASAAAALTLMALPEARFKRTNMVAVAVDFVFCVLPLMPAFLGTKVEYYRNYRW